MGASRHIMIAEKLSKTELISELRDFADMNGTKIGKCLHKLLDLYESYEPYLSPDFYVVLELELEEQLEKHHEYEVTNFEI